MSMQDCLYCEPGNPCESHAPKARKVSRRSQKPKGKIENLLTNPPKHDTIDLLAEIKTSRFDGLLKGEESLPVDTLEYREAIRALWPILSEDAKSRLRTELTVPKSAARMRRISEVRRQLNEEDELSTSIQSS